MAISKSVVPLEAHFLFIDYLNLLHVQFLHHHQELLKHVFTVQFLHMPTQDSMGVVHSA